MAPHIRSHRAPCSCFPRKVSLQLSSEQSVGDQWRRNYEDRGVHCTPQVQDLYPLYLPSQRCGLCQNFKQTTLTTRLYKVRTNLYPPPLTKTFRRACRSCRDYAAGLEESSTGEVPRLQKFCRHNCWTGAPSPRSLVRPCGVDVRPFGRRMGGPSPRERLTPLHQRGVAIVGVPHQQIRTSPRRAGTSVCISLRRHFRARRRQFADRQIRDARPVTENRTTNIYRDLISAGSINEYNHLESDVCCRLQVAPSGKSYGGNRRPGRK